MPNTAKKYLDPHYIPQYPCQTAKKKFLQAMVCLVQSLPKKTSLCGRYFACFATFYTYTVYIYIYIYNIYIYIYIYTHTSSIGPLVLVSIRPCKLVFGLDTDDSFQTFGFPGRAEPIPGFHREVVASALVTPDVEAMA